MPSEPGIEAVYVFLAPTVFPEGWQIQPHQPAPDIARRYWATKGRSEFAIYPPWQNTGWEIPPFQPQHPKPERNGAWMAGDQGTQSPFVFVAPVQVTMTWDVQQPHLKNVLSRGAALVGASDFASFSFVPYGWEIPSPQPPKPRPERAGAFLMSEPGVEAVYVFVPPPALPRGWDGQPWQPLPRPTRSAGMVRWDEGIEFPLVRFFPTGWEIAPHQPQHPRPERVASLFGGDQGTESPFVLFLPNDWDIHPFQPSHPRPERAGSIMAGDQGTEAQFIFIPPAFFTDAWEVQAWQPPHPRPERAGAIMRGDEGIQAAFVRWLNAGWEIPSFQPPHRAPEWRAATFFRGDDGTQFQLIVPYQEGWHIPPFQPPHPRPERFGSVVVGHAGIDFPFVFVPPPIIALFNPIYVTIAQQRVTSTGSSARVQISHADQRSTSTRKP